MNIGAYTATTLGNHIGVYQNDASVTTTVIITDVDTDETWADGDTDLVITGSGFTV
jgi:hypothetical protein